MEDGSTSMITLIALLALVLCSAFFSAAETAYTCLNRVRVKNMASEGNAKAKAVLALAENYDKLISTILIGNNIVNILASSVATVFFVKLLGANGVSASTAIMTFVILLFGEIAPKSVARVKSESFAFAFYPLLRVIVTVFTPLNALMGQWQRLWGKIAHEDAEHGVTEEELITMVEEAEDGGEFNEHESELIRSAIEFVDMQAEDILTPRVDVVAADVDSTIEELTALFTQSEFSRLPIYEDGIDNIVGILHEKDFVRGRGKLSTREMMTDPICIMPTMRLSVLLKHLQQSKAHMAIVMDEYGGLLGLLTLEDILEELVGEIWDEHDEVVNNINPLSENSFSVRGDAPLSEIAELFDLKKEYESVTVSGWVIEELGAFPKVGDVFECEGLKVIVKNIAKHRVGLIWIEDNRPKEED